MTRRPIGRSTLAAALALSLAAGACSNSGAGRTAAPASTGAASASPVTTAPAPTAPGISGGSTSTVVASATTSGSPSASTAQARPAGSPCGGPGPAPATYDHVIWVWMENHRADQVLGKAEAPYETKLAQQCGHATKYGSVGSPSLPNYIGATSGSTSHIGDDAPPASHVLLDDNLFRQVRATGRGAMSYEEAMPAACATRSSGTYAVKHNPAAYYQSPGDRDACTRDDVPLGTIEQGAFHDALAADSLPAFSFVTPDMCHDTHDCAVGDGDRWLSSFLPTILDSATYRAGRTAVLLVWDEDSPMPFIPIAPTVPTGSVLASAVDHYALLRTTEEMLGISSYLGGAATAPSMRAAFSL